MADESDSVWYYSGPADDGTGGPINSSKVRSNVLEDVYFSAPLSEAIIGSDTYFCGYIKNDHPTETLSNVVIFLDSNTISEDDELQIGKGTAAKNASEQTIVNINTEPDDIEWTLAPTYNQGILLATKLAPGEYQSFWTWRHINPTQVESKNRAELIIAFDPPPGSTGTGSGSGTGTPGGDGGGGSDPTSPVSTYSYAVTGDWSTSNDAEDTVENILNFDDIELTLTTGDMSYEDDGDDWADITEELREDGREMKGCLGNHDRREGTPQPELTNFYLEMFGADNDGKAYYDFTYNNTYFIFGDCYSDFDIGSRQYNWIKDKMQKAKNNSAITWRVLFFHEPIYTSPAHYDGDSDLRDAYHPLMIANDFDLFFNGHNHNYCRSYPLNYNSGRPSSPTKVDEGDEPNYSEPGVPVFIQIGTAGRSSHRDFDDDASYIAKQQDSSYGFLKVTVSSSGRQLTGRFYKNNGSVLFEKFTIIK